jgi:hypothetical protein
VLKNSLNCLLQKLLEKILKKRDVEVEKLRGLLSKSEFFKDFNPSMR